MPDIYNEFVNLENIKNFEKKLETETDAVHREVLLQLLAEERAKRVAASSPKT